MTLTDEARKALKFLKSLQSNPSACSRCGACCKRPPRLAFEDIAAFKQTHWRGFVIMNNSLPVIKKSKSGYCYFYREDIGCILHNIKTNEGDPVKPMICRIQFCQESTGLHDGEYPFFKDTISRLFEPFLITDADVPYDFWASATDESNGRR